MYTFTIWATIVNVYIILELNTGLRKDFANIHPYYLNPIESREAPWDRVKPTNKRSSIDCKVSVYVFVDTTEHLTTLDTRTWTHVTMSSDNITIIPCTPTFPSVRDFILSLPDLHHIKYTIEGLVGEDLSKNLPSLGIKNMMHKNYIKDRIDWIQSTADWG